MISVRSLALSLELLMHKHMHFSLLLCICDFFNFLWWNLPKFSQNIASTEIQILNMNKVGFISAVFLIFANFCLLLLLKKWSYRFCWKMSSNLSKIFITSLPNFIEFHWMKHKKETQDKKIHCQFWLALLLTSDNIENTDIFIQAHILLKLLSLAHVIVKL